METQFKSTWMQAAHSIGQQPPLSPPSTAKTVNWGMFVPPSSGSNGAQPAASAWGVHSLPQDHSWSAAAAGKGTFNGLNGAN